MGQLHLEYTTHHVTFRDEKTTIVHPGDADLIAGLVFLQRF